MEKKIKLSGKLSTNVQGDMLLVSASEGMVAVNVMDTEYMTLWMWHPLSGWLIHQRFEIGGKDEPNTEGRIAIGG